MNRLFFFVISAIILTSTIAAAKEIKISYISRQNIYIDAGKADGVAVGDSVIVKHGESPVALLTIEYAAEHSSSAVLKKGKAPQIGDEVVLLVRRKPKVIAKPAGRTRTQKKRITSKRSNFENRTKVSGSLSFSWHHLEDLSSRKMTFDQPGARINLKIKNIFGQGYELRVKNRFRYQRRSYTYSERLPSEEWRNRIYLVSFSYENEAAPINYQVGRVLSSTIGSVGYLDGAMIQANVSSGLHAGLFAGTRFVDQNSNLPSGIGKYGLFARVSRGEYQTKRWESAITLSGEYVKGTIDRELVYVMNSFYSRRLSIYQSADFDINRAWRQERAGKSIALSNLYINGNVKLSNALSIGVSYDNRQNYYSYQWRSIADSLFDDAMRYGARGSINLRLPNYWSMMVNGGIRSTEGDSRNSTSYAASLRKSNISSLRLFFGLYASGFSNTFTQGNHASIRIGANLRSGHSFDVAYGGYYYTTNMTKESRTSQWVRSNLNFYLGQHWYLMQSYEYFWGDDAPGHRVFVEVGYRL